MSAFESDLILIKLASNSF